MLIKKSKIKLICCFNSFNGYLCVLMDICVRMGASEIIQTGGGGACPKRLKTPGLHSVKQHLTCIWLMTLNYKHMQFK